MSLETQISVKSPIDFNVMEHNGDEISSMIVKLTAEMHLIHNYYQEHVEDVLPVLVSNQKLQLHW